ncbi:Regulatory protein RecX [termite gut metagenome]|uniref:Regulatory protein RecX n=1 Tax=termite gut metagenome TaxID=433724 RepID=A0A5J4RFH7_9ZZZZ
MTENEALNHMATYCSKAEHCHADICEKLRRQELGEDAIERILSRLEAEGFIDEKRYTRSFVNDKFRFAKWGKMKIRQALFFKQIPSGVVEKGLGELNENEYLSVLRELIEKKKKSIQDENEYEQKGRLIRFALGKGFEIKDIEKCIKTEDGW